MSLHDDLAPLVHGGDLGSARRMFPGAPEPFIDLSTGINPHAYPIPSLAPDAFRRLPEPAAAERLRDLAARAYGAPSAAHVAAVPGSQIIPGWLASQLPPGRALLLGPTYAEHARVARLAGHAVEEVGEVEELADANLAIVVNPNNPDGRVVAKAALLALGDKLRSGRGLLLVDEAFMDVGPRDMSLCPDVGRGGIVVLRSFGKFFGLGGLRLGFVVAAPEMAARMRALLGPWAVSGPAIAIASAALADTAWAAATRARLAADTARLDELLIRAGFAVTGGTSLFRLARAGNAAARFDQLGRAGILVRRFAEEPRWLRFGLPADQPAWQRLQAALDA
jgi:cobalamin biosynthetic protein CobC